MSSLTEIQAEYRRLRDAGLKHFAAVEQMALKFGLDKPTVARTLDKADAEQRSRAARAAKGRMRGEPVVRA
jgi:hypothetical protein